jgi:flagellar M-ring protein FliF
MDWLKNWTAQIQAQMAGLTVSQKMLMASLAVIIAAALFIVSLYAGQPEMVPLIDQASTPGERASITGYLQSRNIRYKVEGDRVLVAADSRLDALAALQMQELLPEDTSHGFSSLIEKQSWWQSSEQNRQLYMIALQNELSRIVSSMRGVSGAKVIISQPRETGFDMTHRRPSASVNVEMKGGALNQKVADAIAGLVAGAVAEMTPEDVTVIDAVAGRQFRTSDSDELVPGDFLELVQLQEKIYREKIASALGYIPKVIVAVNVEIEARQRHTDSTSYDKDKSVTLVTRERSKSQTSTEPGAGGEPGVRANTGVDIAGSTQPGREQSIEETESEFDPYAGMTHEKIFDPGGLPTRVSATINVPRSYFVAIYKQRRPDSAETEPTDTELQSLFQENLDRIKRQVEPLLTTKQEGQVVVDVYPDTAPELAIAGSAMASVSGGGLGGMLSGGIVRMAGLGALAMTALAAMFLMIRKAGQPETIPTATELAGIPPQFTEANELACLARPMVKMEAANCQWLKGWNDGPKMTGADES